MGRLWLFGDSYAVDHTCGAAAGLEQQWHRIVAGELGMVRETHARGGSPLDHLYHVWFSQQDRIAAGDLVVVALTEPGRRWLLADKPQYSIPHCLFQRRYDDHVPADLLKYMRDYLKHLDHDGAREAHLYNWLCAAASVGARILILPGFGETVARISKWADRFKELGIAQGSLETVSIREHAGSLRRYYPLLDGRCNHLCCPNHRVLADKILRWYHDGSAVDLTTGFMENLITQKHSDDTDLFVSTHQLQPR